MDSYNGGPRGGPGELCGGAFCERDGLKREQFTYERKTNRFRSGGMPGMIGGGFESYSYSLDITLNGSVVHSIPNELGDPKMERMIQSLAEQRGKPFETVEAESWIQARLTKYPGVKSGTHMELGCHHAEMNVVCNCAASGVKSSGAWLIVTGEPCLMCAKMIHHAGIVKVIIIDGGYSGENGLEYLAQNKIPVEKVEGPKDPR